MNSSTTSLEFLAHAARLLLEYNESTAAIHRELQSASHSLVGKPCHVAVAYGGVTVSYEGEVPVFEPVAELHTNSALLERVHAILDRIRAGTLSLEAGLDALRHAEAQTERHSRGLTVLLLGAAAAALCILLGGDGGAAAVVGASSALGLLVRQELGRSPGALLSLPFAAAAIGAIFGGMAIRWGWTQTTQLAVMVPALMLVPGAHFLNGIFDLTDNHVPMSVARLGLAIGILLAITLGIVVGVRVTLPGAPIDATARTGHLNLVSDMLLAGVVTCGFAALYNTSWRCLGLAAIGGMLGHGVRFLALEGDAHLEIATFFGGLTVGLIAGWLSRSVRVPAAIVAFAGAVTMMPGLAIFRALAGMLQLARSRGTSNLDVLAATCTNASQATITVGALALGVILGARAIPLLKGSPLAPGRDV
jgi:uncharacterized membrane protein YjjP (DUF1212 family)